MKRRPHGFTIVELMVTLAIATILLAIAAPSYREFLADSRMSAEATEFLTALNFTRSEAIKRDARVTVCKSSAETGCATTGSWQQGWIVFVDVVDVDAGTAGTFDSGHDTILRVHGPLTTGSTLVGSEFVVDYVSYIPDGRSQLANGAAQGTFDLCSSGASAKGRTVSLVLGRAQVGPEPKVNC